MALDDHTLNEMISHAEEGWDDTDFARCDTEWGPGAFQLLPAYLHERLTQRASREGVSEMSVIRDALEQFLQPA